MNASMRWAYLCTAKPAARSDVAAHGYCISPPLHRITKLTFPQSFCDGEGVGGETHLLHGDEPPEPIADPLRQVQLVRALMEAVLLARIDDQFRLDARALEAP